MSKADSSSLQKRLQGMTSTKIFVCSKKKVNEDKADIKEAVKKWAQARGMGKYSE